MIEDELEQSPKAEATASVEEKTGAMAETEATQETERSGEGNGEGTDSPDSSLKAPIGLPADVRTKLRKLEKLESRYQGMVKSGWKSQLF